MGVKRIKKFLTRRHSPRLHMFLIVSASGVTAFGVSYLLLHSDVLKMSIRYPISVLTGYIGFYIFFRIWLFLYTKSAPLDIGGHARDLIDATSNRVSSGDHVPSSAHVVNSGNESTWSTPDIVPSVDADESLPVILLFLLLLVVVLGGLLICGYLVWSAPTLFAEVLVDGFVMNGVYRKIKQIPESLWMGAVFKKTWFLALLLMIFSSLAGYAMQSLHGDVISFGQFLSKILK